MKCAAKVIEICTISWDASRCVCVRVCVYVRVLHKVVLTVSLIRQSRPYGSGRRAGHLNGVVCPVVVSVVVGVWQPCGVSRIISFLKPFLGVVVFPSWRAEWQRFAMRGVGVGQVINIIISFLLHSGFTCLRDAFYPRQLLHMDVVAHSV